MNSSSTQRSKRRNRHGNDGVDARTSSPGIVRTHNPDVQRQTSAQAKSRFGLSFEGLTHRWEQAWIESLARQRDAIDWWLEFGKSSTDVESLIRKVSELRRRLLAATLAMTQDSVKLAEDQQRTAWVFGEQTLASAGPASIAEVQSIAATLWPIATGMALAWVMIPLSSQAKMAKAWADFRSLPTAGGSGK